MLRLQGIYSTWMLVFSRLLSATFVDGVQIGLPKAALVISSFSWVERPLSCLWLYFPSFACPSSFFESWTSSIGRQGFDAEKCISTPQNLAWKTSHRCDAHSKMSSNHESHLHSFPITRYLNYTCTVHSMFSQDRLIAAVSSLVVVAFT